MRVLAVTPLYPPRSRVGAWLATHLFLRHLVQRGHQVTAFTFRDYGKSWDVDGVRVATATRGASYAHHLAADADVVISHVGDGGKGGKVAERADIPSVQMVHGQLGGAKVHRASLVVWNAEHLQRAHPLDV